MLFAFVFMFETRHEVLARGRHLLPFDSDIQTEMLEEFARINLASVQWRWSLQRCGRAGRTGVYAGREFHAAVMGRAACIFSLVPRGGGVLGQR